MARPSVKPKSAAGRLADQAVFGGIRAALAVPQVAGLEASLHAADALGTHMARARFNRKRVTRAKDRIGQAFRHMTPQQREDLLTAGYRHLMRLAVEVATAPRLMTRGSWTDHLELGNIAEALDELLSGKPVIVVTGHCGNWEIVGAMLALLGIPVHAVYRPLDLKPLDRWVRESRARSGMHLVDKFGAVRVLPEAMRTGGAPAFVADQNAGDRGVFVPFFGRLTSTYKSVGLLAMQQNAVVVCGFGKRVAMSDLTPAERHRARGLKYHISVTDVIRPDDYLSQPDPLYYLTARYRRAIERMVAEAPEQYLWMHRIWKSRPPHERRNQPFPANLRDKLAALPWLDDADVTTLIDRSDKDRAWLTANDTDRLL